MMSKRESEGGALERQSAERPRQRPRKLYSRPRLEALGALRDITLAGTSPGIGDSQFPNTKP